MRFVMKLSVNRSTRKNNRLLLIVLVILGQLCAWKCAGTQFHLEIGQGTSQVLPLTLICDGRVFDPSYNICLTNRWLDRSSAESLIANYCTATADHNTALFNSLYATNEQTTTLEADPNDHLDWMALKVTINYGSYTIAILQGSANNQLGSECIAMKRIGISFYLTDALIKDRAYNFLKNIIQEPSLNYKEVLNPGAETTNVVRYIYYPFTNNVEQPPMVVEWRGKKYDRSQPLQFQNLASTNEMLATPEMADEAVYAAASKTNFDWYCSLIRPDELSVPFKTVLGVSETIKDNVAKNLNRAGQRIQFEGEIFISSVVYYSNYAFVTTESLTGDQDTLIFKSDGKMWLLSDELNRSGNMVRNFLMNANSPDTIPLFPKILPR